MYQSLINIPTEYNGKDTGHIIGVYNKNINYLYNNITPIFIFDGHPPKYKSNLIQNRNKKAKEAKEKMNNSICVSEYQKNKKKSIRLTRQHIEDVKELLNYMGISYIHPEYGEAEGIASELCRIKYVDYVMPEDMDSLAFGSPLLARKCIDKTIKRKDIVSIFNLNTLLKDLQLNYNEFIELCILCGCDYCENIYNIGYKKAFNIITKYKSIDNYLNEVNINNLPSNYKEKYNFSKEYFISYRGKFDNNVPIISSKINTLKLTEHLINIYNMKESKINNSLQKLNRVLKTY